MRFTQGQVVTLGEGAGQRLALFMDKGECGFPTSCVVSKQHFHTASGGYVTAASADGRVARPVVVLDPQSEADHLRAYNGTWGVDKKVLTSSSHDYWRKKLERMLPPEVPTTCGEGVTIAGTDYPCVKGYNHQGKHSLGDGITVSWS